MHVVVADFCRWVCARTATVVGEGEGVFPTTWAHGVGFLVTFTKGRGTTSLNLPWVMPGWADGTSGWIFVERWEDRRVDEPSGGTGVNLLGKMMGLG